MPGTRTAGVCVVVLALSVLVPNLNVARGDHHSTTATPQPLVDSYSSLADALLAMKQTEWNLVHSILATTYGHAEAAFAGATRKMRAGEDARTEVENLATLVAQMGNEGDAAVAAVRKRLIEAGHHHHHHHADGDQKDKYDEGFVIVTRESKKAFLDAAKRIGKLGGGDAAALEVEWKKVRTLFEALHEGATH